MSKGDGHPRNVREEQISGVNRVQMCLENIDGEIGNMVCGPDPEELCKPHQEIWILCYWE